jgi:phospholipid/cholesterol/gamma-HCH transport system permease protein
MEERDGAQVLVLSGTMTLSGLGTLADDLERLPNPPHHIDLGEIDRIDTIGAWVIHRTQKRFAVPVSGGSGDVIRLLNQVTHAEQPVQIHPDHTPPWQRVMAEIGAGSIQAMRTLKGLLGFFGAVIMSLGHVITHPRKIRFHAVVHRFETVGVQALAIIGLMSFLIGIVIAQQGAVQLRQFGAEVFTINLIGRLTTRELGILMTAIMVAGRSGSAFAAQIGSMKLAEEVDAMRTIGVSPMEALVLPRIIATVVLMPLLGCYASLIAILGGGLFCWISLEIPPVTFVQRIREVVLITDLWVGLIKAPVFGWIIAMSGCFQGMQVQGNNEEVGLKTTAAVVQAIFLVIVLDAFFAVFFTSIGWN